MPTGVFLYEVDKSFGPNVIAEYYLGSDRITMDALKLFVEKHLKKGFVDATIQIEEKKFYSSKVHAESIDKENLFLGFILKEEEDVVSLKSIFQKSEARILEKYSKDKMKMKNVLKEILSSILTLMDKLMEPKLIIETINEKTKKMLDDGKLQEARELIDLGEEIPEKLSTEVKEAEELYHQGSYKKAKKSFLNAAKLAAQIQEGEILTFLQNKAEHVGNIPDLIKKRESLIKDFGKILSNIDIKPLELYESLSNTIDTMIKISNALEYNEQVENLIEMKKISERISKYTKDLTNLDNKLKEVSNKII